MNRENKLYEACRVLFGDEIVLSPEFLTYLKEEGITSAYRKRAREVHPDRALSSGLSEEKCRQEFVALQVACETLRGHVTSRELISRVPVPLSADILPERILPFGRFLYYLGVIQWRQLVQALTWQKTGRFKIGELGVRQGYLDRNSVGIILKNSRVSGSFGLTAVKLGLLTREEVRELLLRQKHQQKKIGQFFLENGVLSRMELEVLLRQCRNHNSRIQRICEK